MIILGIDPGFAITGYGIIKVLNNKFLFVDYGVIKTAASEKLSNRLLYVSNEMERIIEQYKPDAVAIEELFFSNNAKTAINVGQGRGAVLVTVAKKGYDVYEYTPLQVKQAVTGYGRADKQQIQTMVKMLLKLDEIPKPDDAADALAVALCHAQSYKMAKYC